MKTIDDLHGDESYREASREEEAIAIMQEEINDLKWRINQICNFLSLNCENV